MSVQFLSLMTALAVSSSSFAQEVDEPMSREDYVKVIDNFPLPSEGDLLRAFSKDKSYVLPAPLEDTFTLHSNPTATKVIYLDFDGHSIIWRGDDFHYVPFNMEDPDSTFSDTELTVIQLAWQSISEDFLPFDLDVTTEDPGIKALMNSGGADTEWGIRAVISHNDGTSSWAYNNSFNSSDDTELYAWAGNFASVYETWIWIADSVSHEAGHSLGLSHDGTTTGVEYYEGHGKGDTSWSPIMGWTNYGLSQWDQGEYTRADNQEDDLSIITTGHGFDYRLDDHGSTTATATVIDIDVDLPAVTEGIIEQTTDIDYFSFTVPSDGPSLITVSPDILAPNLDIEATLYDSEGAVLFTSNPPTALDAEFDVVLTAGDYYLSVDGIGYEDPLSDGYSDYGTLGYYLVRFSYNGDTGDTGDTGKASDTGDTGKPTDTSDTNTIKDSGDDEDSGHYHADDQPADNTDSSSCGCNTSNASWPGMMFLLLFLVRRRQWGDVPA